MEKERNLNYWTIRKFSLLYSYYAIIDTTDYLADQLFVKNEVRMWFGQEYMLLRGHTDYTTFCEGIKNKIAAVWKSGGELQHEEARPSA